MRLAPLRKSKIQRKAIEAFAFLQGKKPSRVPVNPMLLGQPARELFGKSVMDFYMNPRWGGQVPV